MLLYDQGFAETEEFKVSPLGYTVNVAGGKKDVLPLCAETSLSVGTKRGKVPELTEKAYIRHFVYAPVEKGEYAGYVDYYYGDRFVGSVDLFTDESAEINSPPPKKENILDKALKFFKK